MKKHKKLKSNFQKQFAIFLKHPFVKKNEPMLHTVEWLLLLLAFYIIGFLIIYSESTPKRDIIVADNVDITREAGIQVPSMEEQENFAGETIAEPIDTTDWDVYQNKWYGFEIKHPDVWTDMQLQTRTVKNARFETVYKFRKDLIGEDDQYAGFDVVVYSIKNADTPEETNEMEKKEDAPEDLSECQSSQEITLGEDDNVFQEVNVNQDNVCYEPTYFFSIKKDGYLFNLVPVRKEGTDMPSDIGLDISKNFPEFKEAVASFKFISISRPQAIPKVISPPKPDPRKGIHKPLQARITKAGKLICIVKNDHPSSSDRKGRHMDEDCCPDPDEWANPWCSYSAAGQSVLVSPKK